MKHNIKNRKDNSLSEIRENENKKLLDKLIMKIPSWSNYNIDLPKGLSIEQSSSENTAIIKASLIYYDNVIDLTGGFGVDSYFFSLKAKRLIYLEPNSELFELVKKNFDRWGFDNVEFKNETAEKFLNKYYDKVDLIYCDPSRRIESKKVFKLEDSEPNIIELFDVIKSKCKYFLLKTSPFLDINLVKNSFNYIAKIILISIDHELKEVLYLFNFEQLNEIEYQAFLINKSYCSKYLFKNEKYEVEYQEPNNYLYEPDSSIMKMSNFSEIAHLYNLTKLEVNSHLFSSKELINDFPGKVYKVVGVEKVNDKVLRKYLNSNKCNLKIRNFPDTVENLKKKLKISDGGELYIFATKLFNKKYVLIICEKIFI